MATAVVGQPHTFTVLFLDAGNLPILATGTTIKIFRFGTTGNEIALQTAPMTAVPGDPGRFQYTYTVPSYLTAGDILHATMQGIKPISLDLLLVQDSADLVPPASDSGLRYRFIP